MCPRVSGTVVWPGCIIYFPPARRARTARRCAIGPIDGASIASAAPTRPLCVLIGGMTNR